MTVASGDLVVSSSSAISPLSPAQSSATAPVDDEEDVQLWDTNNTVEKGTTSGGLPIECDSTTNDTEGVSKNEPESDSGTESEAEVGHDSDSDGIEYSEDRQTFNDPSDEISTVASVDAGDGKLENPFDVHTAVDSAVQHEQNAEDQGNVQKRSEKDFDEDDVEKADVSETQPVSEAQNIAIQIEEDRNSKSEEPISPRDDRDSFLRTAEGQKFKHIMLRGIEVGKWIVF
jgi:hypothetical protein